MKIVIDIPEVTYKQVCWRGLSLCPRDSEALILSIKKGTPLPKGHGDLIDRDKLIGYIHGTKSIIATLDAPTVIEADK